MIENRRVDQGSSFGNRILSFFLVFAIAFAPLSGFTKSSQVISPTRQIPETIDDLIDAIQSPHLGTHAKELSAQSEEPVVSDPAQALVTIFDPEYLNTHKEFFRGESEFLGDAGEIDRFAFKLFEQWIYLELYQVRRLEYLMMNYAKLLLLDSTMQDSAAEEFSLRFPEDQIAHSPLLQAQHARIKSQLRSENIEERRDAREYARGLVESAYLAMAALDHKRDLLNKRYNEDDDRFTQGMANIKEKEQLVHHASAYLQTRTMESRVAPFVHTEALPVQLKMEAATNRYLKRLNTYLEKERSISDLYSFLNNSGMVRLNEEFIISLESEEGKKFRHRIESSFDQATIELRINMEKVISESVATPLPFSLANYISISNASSTADMRDYAQWLEKIFKEQPIHWTITEEFPFLQSAAEGLSNYVAEEIRQQRLDRLMEISAATLLLSVSPLGRIGNRVSGWMGRQLLQFWRFANLGLKGALVTYFSYGTYKRFLEWKRMQRLSATNLEGPGLVSLIQAEGAFTNFLLYGALTGGTMVLSVSSSRGFWREISKEQRSTNRLLKAFQRTWNNNPIALAAFNRNSLRHWNGMQTAIKSLEFKVAGKHLLTIGSNIGAIFTQFFTMVPAHMPNWVKTFLHTIPSKVYSGVTLGTVMGIMGVTVQSYITAGGLKAFVWGFEKIGFTPPEYWQQNALNQAERLKRDAFLAIERDLIFSRQEMAKSLGMITMWKQALKNPDLSDEDRENLKAAILGSEQAIQNQLQITLLRWFKYAEVRELQNSILKEKGFGILASPNYDDPVRITIFAEMGGKVLAHAMTVKEIEHILNRTTIPDLGMDTGDLQALAERLGL